MTEPTTSNPANFLVSYKENSPQEVNVSVDYIAHLKKNITLKTGDYNKSCKLISVPYRANLFKIRRFEVFF